MQKLTIFVFSLWIYLFATKVNCNVNAAEQCLDRLPNCSTLDLQGICNTRDDLDLVNALDCARTCGLCLSSTLMHIRRVSNHNRQPNVKITHSKKHSGSNASKSHNSQRHKSRPSRTKSRPTIRVKSRRATAIRAKSKAKHPTTYVKSRPKKHRSKSSKHKSQVKNKNSSKQHKSIAKTLHKPKQQSVAFHPIGPNQLRIDPDVILASQLIKTKNDAYKINVKFNDMVQNAETIVKELDQILAQIAENERTSTSKILMDIQHPEHIRTRAKRQSMFSGSGAGWTERTQNVHVHSKMFVRDTRRTHYEITQLWISVKGHKSSVIISESRSRMVTNYAAAEIAFDFPPTQGMSEKREVLASVLGSFATDFGRVKEDLETLQTKMEPVLELIRKLVVLAESNGNISEAKMLTQQILFEFKNIKEYVTETANIFSTATNDFGGIADYFDKNRSDLPSKRTPVTVGIPKKKEDPKASQTENQRISKSNSPINKLPPTGTPKSNSPANKLPQNETPQHGSPQINLPSNGSPPNQKPQTNLPSNNSPTNKQPQTNLSSNNSPQNETPQTNLPPVNSTPNKTSQINLPSNNSPSNKPPQTRNPQQPPEQINTNPTKSDPQKQPGQSNTLPDSPKIPEKSNPNNSKQPDQTNTNGSSKQPDNSSESKKSPNQSDQSNQNPESSKPREKTSDQKGIPVVNNPPQGTLDSNKSPPNNPNSDTPQESEKPKDQETKQEVTLQCLNNKFLSLKEGPKLELQCDQPEAKTKQEHFTLVTTKDNKVALMAINNQYCSRAVTANSACNLGSAETSLFKLIHNKEDDTVTFECDDGRHWEYLFSGGLRCAGTRIERSSKFRMTVIKQDPNSEITRQKMVKIEEENPETQSQQETLNSNTPTQNQSPNADTPIQNQPEAPDEEQKFSIKCPNNKYMKVTGVSNLQLTCTNFDAMSEQEHFQLKNVNDKVSIIAADGRYCDGKVGFTETTMKCNSESATDWTQFVTFKNADETRSFKCSGGAFVELQPDNGLKCVGQQIGPMSSFTVTAIEANV